MADQGHVEVSTVRDFFHPLNGTETRAPPSLTTRDRELVSVIEVRIEPWELNPRPLTPQSPTLPTLPRAISIEFIIISPLLLLLARYYYYYLLNLLLLDFLHRY